MLLEKIKLTNFLSFGSHSPEIPLQKLNVLIGPNGSGKSNLLESIELLQNVPEQLLKPIREGGGITDWLWKGTESKNPIATLDVVVNTGLKHTQPLRYKLSFTSLNQRFEITDEVIEEESSRSEQHITPYIYYHFNEGNPILNIKGNRRSLQRESIDMNESILSQRRDPEQYPEITYLAQFFKKIKLYREWSFGRYTPPRLPQKADLPNEHLLSDASNLGLVLNRLRRDPKTKKEILSSIQALYEGIDDYDVQIEGGTVQVFLHEGQVVIPATRLSDGTLRYLCLLAILCHPNPPPLVCIEEPELGLHPELLPKLAELLQEASKRCQLFITTHSDILVDALSEAPESILITEKREGSTNITRLDEQEVQHWLNKYRLGELWLRGDIGGTRW